MKKKIYVLLQDANGNHYGGTYAKFKPTLKYKDLPHNMAVLIAGSKCKSVVFKFEKWNPLNKTAAIYKRIK